MSEPVGVRPKNLSQAKKKEEGGFGETVKVIIQALLIALVVRTLLFQPFNIPSGSMIPTLLIGDYLFVSKYSYGYSKHSIPFSPNLFEGRILASPPKRGDVVVFKLPRDNSTDSRVAPEQGGVGYVPFENLIGRAEITFFSVDNGQPAWAFWKWPWTVRWHRMFQPVR